MALVKSSPSESPAKDAASLPWGSRKTGDTADHGGAPTRQPHDLTRPTGTLGNGTDKDTDAIENGTSRRNAEIIRRVRDGETGQAVADDLGITRARVEQIVHRTEHRARRAFRKALAHGRIGSTSFCQMCGTAAPDGAHHASYEHPLLVIWLCGPCHAEADARRRRRLAGEPIQGTAPEELLTRLEAATRIGCSPLRLRTIAARFGLRDVRKRGKQSFYRPEDVERTRLALAEAKDRRRDFCRRGHRMTPENTGYINGTAKFCRACKSLSVNRIQRGVERITDRASRYAVSEVVRLSPVVVVESTSRSFTIRAGNRSATLASGGSNPWCLREGGAVIARAWTVAEVGKLLADWCATRSMPVAA